MSTRRTLIFGVTLAAAAGLNLGSASGAGAKGPRVGPNQQFVGLVNGSTGRQEHAQIRVACPGPGEGQTTHPLEGQTLSVSPPPSAGGTVGDTGPRGRRINVYMGIPPTASSAGGVASFTHYGKKKPIPTTLDVPCSGSGYMTFMAFPRDPGASRAFVVPVDYVNIAA